MVVQSDLKKEEQTAAEKLSGFELKAGNVVVTNFWGNKERIKNLGKAISNMSGGKIFLSGEEVAGIFNATESALKRIPKVKLDHLKGRGYPRKYTINDLAHYCINNPDCKILKLGQGSGKK